MALRLSGLGDLALCRDFASRTLNKVEKVFIQLPEEQQVTDLGKYCQDLESLRIANFDKLYNLWVKCGGLKVKLPEILNDVYKEVWRS